MPATEDLSAPDDQTDAKHGPMPSKPAGTVRQAIRAQGREAVKATFTQLIHDAISGTDLPQEEAIRDHMDDIVRRIADGFDQVFPGESL